MVRDTWGAAWGAGGQEHSSQRHGMASAGTAGRLTPRVRPEGRRFPQALLGSCSMRTCLLTKEQEQRGGFQQWGRGPPERWEEGEVSAECRSGVRPSSGLAPRPGS